MTITYDSGGNQITSATSGPGTGQPSVTLTSAYNAQHSRTSLADNLSSQGIVSFAYDSGQRVTTITTSYGGAAGLQVVFNYDPANRLTFESRADASKSTFVNTTYSYDAANRQTTITDQAVTPVSGGAPTIVALATYVYSYDKADRVTAERDTEGTASFTYDNANELTGVTGSRTESYAYDLNGNRTGTGYSTTVMNERATSPGITYTFDNAGNMISAKNGSTITTYTYDYRNRMTQVTQGGTVIASYTYDAMDRRIGIVDGGTRTWTVYDGTQPYADFSSSGTLLERYLSGASVIDGAVVDELLARTSSGGATAWYLTDKLGSVRDIASTTGSSLDHVVYDSFGNIVTETNTGNGDRFKYAGMEYDSTTVQYYDRARDYDSATGTFMGQDPMGFAAGDSNLYRYVGNRPFSATDPTGLSGIWDTVKTGMGAVSSAAHDAGNMFAYSGAALSGAVQGAGDGLAMLTNAATFQMTPLNNYVQGRIAMEGGAYGIANAAANVAVLSASMAVGMGPCGLLKVGVNSMAFGASAVEVSNGIAQGDAGMVGMGVLGMGTLMVGNWCFVEGTQIHIAGDQDTSPEAALIAGGGSGKGSSDTEDLWGQRALGFVCLAFGMGAYLSSKAHARRQSRRKYELFVDAALEETFGGEPVEPEDD